MLSKIKGVSDKRIADFNKLNINSCKALIKHYPRNYLDLSKISPIKNCVNNEMALIKATVITMPENKVSGARKLNYIKVVCTSGGDYLTCIWFNQPYVLKKLILNTEYLFYGRVKNSFGQITITNPNFEPLDKNYKLKGIIPVYRLSGGLTQGVVKKTIWEALKVTPIKSSIPMRLEAKYSLYSLKNAYLELHNPTSFSGIKEASERVALEEYFALMSAFKLLKGGKDKIRNNHYNIVAQDIKEFAKRFGFELTNGQKNAINEIFADLKGHTVMNRLLQGDVGSGKTAVAIVSMFVALKSGYQVSFLCPTEILAQQNYALMKRFLPEFDSVLLTSSNTAKEKKQIKSLIASGEAKIVVGTHAILQDDVIFKNLSLCVCDEQHRFGVAHRNAMSNKGFACDTLVMSATPIPRTFSLTFYGDLDISEIPDKPNKRGELSTHIVTTSKYDDMINFIKKEISNGRQVYFVCPKIEDDVEGEVMSVTELYQSLTERLPNISLALLHGKTKDNQKNQIMSDFKENKISGLVSTTVIEVGIDVPNATVMVIYNSERFGLSQLHQLRGRVGRGENKSYCFLYSDNAEDRALERLRVIRDNTDGFKIAEYDFNMRGGGDFLGTRQSGAFFKELGVLNYDASTIFLAKKLSDEAFEVCSQEEMSTLKQIARKKYYRLKDVTLN